MKTPVTAISLLCSSLLLAATSAIAGNELPQKAVAVEDGIVALRAGVMPSPAAASALPIGKLKYPTRYFVEIVNESPYPVWLDAAWGFPKGRDMKMTHSRVTKSGKLPPGGSYWFYSDRLGVIAEHPVTAAITVWSDEKRTKRIGQQSAELRFSQLDIDVFLDSFPSPYKNQQSDSPPVVISGWADLPKPRSDVPGTAADGVLSADIQRILWKTDSVERFTCAREILDAEVLQVHDSEVLMRMDAEAMEKARIEQEQGVFSVELWRVRSCGEELAYEVLLSAAGEGGTDVMVVRKNNQ